MAYQGRIKQSVARNIIVLMVRADDLVTGLAGLTLTITASKDAAAFGAIAPSVTDLGSGVYAIALTSGHTDTLGYLALHITGTDAQTQDAWWDVIDPPATAAGITALQADTDDIQTRIPTALVGGRMDCSVGAMAANVLTATAINADAITAAKVADGTIDAATFAAGAITSTVFAAGAITATVVATDAIDADALADGAITAATFAAGAIDATAIADSAIDAGAIATGAITSAKFAAGAINAAAIADAAIDAATFAAGAIDATAIATDALGSLELAASAVTEIAAAIPTAAAVADSVWDEATSGHLAGGTFGELMALLYGLSNGMVVIDNTTNTSGGLTAARIRVFTSQAAVFAATDGGSGEGEIAVFDVAASYDGPGKLNVYKSRRTS
jgi:hypothetical protein